MYHLYHLYHACYVCFCFLLYSYTSREITSNSTGNLSIQGLGIAFLFVLTPGFTLSSRLVSELLAPKALGLFFKGVNLFFQSEDMHAKLLVLSFVRQL